MQQFTDKRVEFDAEGGDGQALKLNMLSPAEEFAKKKQSWRTHQLAYQKPPVRRENSSSDEGTHPPSHESSDYDKPKIKRFGEYKVDKGTKGRLAQRSIVRHHRLRILHKL
jgi:hypothetical protein